MINFLLKDETARRVLGGGTSRYLCGWSYVKPEVARRPNSICEYILN